MKNMTKFTSLFSELPWPYSTSGRLTPYDKSFLSDEARLVGHIVSLYADSEAEYNSYVSLNRYHEGVPQYTAPGFILNSWACQFFSKINQLYCRTHTRWNRLISLSSLDNPRPHDLFRNGRTIWLQCISRQHPWLQPHPLSPDPMRYGLIAVTTVQQQSHEFKMILRPYVTQCLPLCYIIKIFCMPRLSSTFSVDRRHLFLVSIHKSQPGFQQLLK